MPSRQLPQLLQPYASRRLEAAKAEKICFSHYTSADAALSIIRNREIWLRSANVMNDFSEIAHGQNCLVHAWKNTSFGQRLQAVMNRRQDGLSKQLEATFNKYLTDRHTDTYLMSISEHHPDDDRLGKLSMWRAYGGHTNVAFVFNTSPLFSESAALPAFSSPVLYATVAEFADHFSQVVTGLEENFAVVQNTDPNQLVSELFFALHMAVLSTKHPGFAEEKEWRILHSPSLGPSERIKFDVVSISGVPQKVYKISLENFPNEGFTGASLPEVLEEIIIGPTQFPYPIYDALVHELTEAGVANAPSKVRVSDIPLRK